MYGSFVDLIRCSQLQSDAPLLTFNRRTSALMQSFSYLNVNFAKIALEKLSVTCRYVEYL